LRWERCGARLSNSFQTISLKERMLQELDSVFCDFKNFNVDNQTILEMAKRDMTLSEFLAHLQEFAQ
jgi:hypothetical protein